MIAIIAEPSHPAFVPLPSRKFVAGQRARQLRPAAAIFPPRSPAMPSNVQAMRRFLLPVVLTALGAALYAWLVPLEQLAVARHMAGFPDSDAASNQLRPLILGGLCFLPALAALTYAFGSALDRYLTRCFLGIFGICFSALLLVWLLIDLENNLGDLRQSGSPIATAAWFYGKRLPAIILLLLPYVMLLSLLYSLGKLSSDREIIAMIQTGRGLIRVSTPLIIAGVFASLLCLGLNYHWAPVAEGRKSEILDAARGRLITEATDVLYRNPVQRRLWMIGAFPRDFERGEPLLDVEVTTTRRDGTLATRMSAKRASWDRAERQWTFDEAVVGRFALGEPPEYDQTEGPITRNWPETPTQLIKPGLAASSLGIPELNSWLSENATHSLNADPSPYLTQWHYRWALPFTCLITVLLAVPLSVHFSRRGAGGGVILAVALSALMMLVSSITLSFGEAGLIRPALAAWLPNFLFGLLGLYLFHRRTAGRPIYQSLRRMFLTAD